MVMDLTTPPDAIHHEEQQEGEGILHKKHKTGEHGLPLHVLGANAGEHGLANMQGLGSDCGDNVSELTRDGALNMFVGEKSTQLLPHLSLVDVDRLIRSSFSSSAIAADIAGEIVQGTDIPFSLNTSYQQCFHNSLLTHF